MKRKINIQFIILTLMAIVITIILSTLVSYTVLKREVMEDLDSYAHALKATDTFNGINFAVCFFDTYDA